MNVQMEYYITADHITTQHNDNSNNIFIAVLYSVLTKEEVSDHNERYNKKTYSSNDNIHYLFINIS